MPHDLARNGYKTAVDLAIEWMTFSYQQGTYSLACFYWVA